MELRGGVVVKSDTILEDGAYIETAVQSFLTSLGLNDHRLHSVNQLLILDYLKLSKMSIDKVTQFGLRPPEFLKLFDSLGEYYIWFIISSKVKRDELENKITISLSTSSWVDGLQRLIKLRKKALPEVIAWCTKIIEEDDIDIVNDVSVLSKMIQLMFKINTLCNDDEDDDSVDD